MAFLTTDDLLTELGGVTSRSDARAMISCAARVAGVPTGRPLQVRELLMVCEALAAEGGAIQQMAEAVATRHCSGSFWERRTTSLVSRRVSGALVVTDYASSAKTVSRATSPHENSAAAKRMPPVRRFRSSSASPERYTRTRCSMPDSS